MHALYKQTFLDLKNRIQLAQIKASLSVNKELILLYWEIGATILKRQQESGWGAKVIEQLSVDLKKSFPDMKGFSPRNLKYMKNFSREFHQNSIGQQLAAQIPWFHVCTILEKIKTENHRVWYIKQTIENGWSRNVLVHQIESNLYERQSGLKINNFKETLPSPISDLANDLFKDPYKFDFLSMTKKVNEKEIEKSLVTHIRQFLLELGQGFAFVGQQVHFELGNNDYYIDLLFYHIHLKCYVVIELKSKAFKPEYAGKLNFYLSLVDKKLKKADDNDTIGLLLCKDKNELIAEYSLKDINKPMGVSEYELISALPKALKSELPSMEEREKSLSAKKN